MVSKNKQPRRMARQPLAMALGLACLQGAAWSQDGASVEEEGVAGQRRSSLKTVVVTGNPLRDQSPVQPTQVLSGDALTVRRGPTLGDTLDGMSGVSSSYFGPNSNRPVLRGLDGDRVRMLSNSGASVDASSLSFDHAVPVDPLVVERIEVLRGAASLLYGGSAIGGVVNTLDNRIPRQAQPGLSGAVDLGWGGAAAARNAAAVVDGGSGDARGGWAWHADLSGRDSTDLHVPRFGADGELSTRVRNSASDSHAGAIGASAIFAQGYVGMSLDDYRNHYGVTVEPDVTIRMQRQRLAAAGEWRAPGTWLPRVQWQFSRSLYEHKEVEGDGAVGTVFSSHGNDVRIEAEHAPLGPVRGVVGVQLERSDFSALGEEALVPNSRTRSAAVFMLEQVRKGPLTLAAGGRLERARVASDGDAAGAEEERFGAAGLRRFKPRSLSLSADYALSPALTLQTNLSSTQRAPTFYELLANGVHVASGAYERGDAGLAMERARGIDLGLKWEQGPRSLRANVFQTRFANYIALDATGASVDTVDEDGETQSVPEYRYAGVPARLYGFEIEWREALPRMAWSGDWQWTLSAQLDGVRGTNRSNGQALPRLAPLRGTWGVQASAGAWNSQLELRTVARQSRVPSEDSATPGYALLRWNLARQFKLAGTDALWYLKLDNLGNKLAYSASTVATLRALAPLPGRSLYTGLQVRF